MPEEPQDTVRRLFPRQVRNDPVGRLKPSPFFTDDGDCLTPIHPAGLSLQPVPSQVNAVARCSVGSLRSTPQPLRSEILFRLHRLVLVLQLRKLSRLCTVPSVLRSSPSSHPSNRPCPMSASRLSLPVGDFRSPIPQFFVRHSLQTSLRILPSCNLLWEILDRCPACFPRLLICRGSSST
jgi:hypothetical protein